MRRHGDVSARSSFPGGARRPAIVVTPNPKTRRTLNAESRLRTRCAGSHCPNHSWRPRPARRQPRQQLSSLTTSHQPLTTHYSPRHCSPPPAPRRLTADAVLAIRFPSVYTGPDVFATRFPDACRLPVRPEPVEGSAPRRRPLARRRRAPSRRYADTRRPRAPIRNRCPVFRRRQASIAAKMRPAATQEFLRRNSSLREPVQIRASRRPGTPDPGRAVGASRAGCSRAPGRPRPPVRSRSRRRRDRESRSPWPVRRLR